MILTTQNVKKRANPLIQTGVSYLFGLVSILVAHFGFGGGESDFTAAFLAIIFFCLVNVLVSIAFPSFLRYTMPSIYLYVVLVAALVLTAKSFSGMSIWDLHVYRMMLTSITMFYITASIMVRVIRLINDWAEKEMHH